jgi:predicted RNA-binding Zn-ribbon protein involved in translation (DUF1610 family)
MDVTQERVCANCLHWRPCDPEAEGETGTCCAGYDGRPMTLAQYDGWEFDNRRVETETCDSWESDWSEGYDPERYGRWETAIAHMDGYHMCGSCRRVWHELYSSLWEFCPNCGRRITKRDRA